MIDPATDDEGFFRNVIATMAKFSAGQNDSAQANATDAPSRLLQ